MATEPQAESSPAREELDPRLLWGLFLAALVVRVIWVLWVHPPQDAEFSDMQRYMERAEGLIERGIGEPKRYLAWQTWGTHYLLALPLWLFGLEFGRTIAALMWASFGAGSVALTALLASRVRPPGQAWRWLPLAAGGAMFLWYPNLAGTGYFLAETPFCFFQLASACALVKLVRRGGATTALAGGVWGALAFAVRPQISVWFVLVFVSVVVFRRKFEKVRAHHHLLVAAPLLAMLAFSFWRFDHHTGYCCGIAENVNMNLTAGRCHNVVTQAFKTEGQLKRSKRRKSTRDGRRVSLPAFRQLKKRGPDHPLALAPARGGLSIKFVGYIGDPDIQREIRQDCIEKTGWLEQARYSVVNVSLLWFVGKQWPDASDRKAPDVLRGLSNAYRYVFMVLWWAPGLAGAFHGLFVLRRNLPLAWCAANLWVSMAVAATFFGTVRLRTPYDPFWILMALWIYGLVWARVQSLRRGKSESDEPK